MKDSRGNPIKKKDAMYVYHRQAAYFKVGLTPDRVLKNMTVAEIRNLCEKMYMMQKPRKRKAWKRYLEKQAKKRKINKFRAFRYKIIGFFIGLKKKPSKQKEKIHANG